MDIHKPKPWHGVREFLKEFGTIVLGVLVALGAEQAVESMHERSQMAEARGALRAEIEDNTRSERHALQEDRCYLKVLDLYDAWAKGGPKPEVPGLTIPYPRATVWDTAKAAAVTHMDLKERLAFAQIYDQATNLESLNTQQRNQGMPIRGYLSLDRLTPAEGRDMIRAVGGYRTLLRGKANQEARYVRMATALGISPQPIEPEEMSYLRQVCALVGVTPETLPQPDDLPSAPGK